MSLKDSSKEKEPLLHEVDEDLKTPREKPAWGMKESFSNPLVPQSFVFRYILLFLICVLTFGSYFSYDNPGALQTQLMNYMNITSLQYEVFYSVYSWPNTVIVFFGGWMIDRFFGIRLGAIIFCLLVCLGQVIFAFGCQLNKYWIAIAGRFVFGLGGESLSVAQSTYVAKWFKGNELAFAFGITLSTSRIGSAVNFNVEPWIAKTWNVPVGMWVGAATCIISLLAALILWVLDRRGEQMMDKPSDVKASDPMSLWDVKDFPGSTWFIFAICVTFYVAIFTFIQVGSDFIHSTYPFSESMAGRALSIKDFMSAGLSPFLGFAVDKVGRALLWVFFASALMSGSLFTFIYMRIAATPWIVIPFMGLAYSLCAAALWPSLAIVVDVDKLGTAYGLMTALQNLGLALSPLAAGWIINREKKKHSPHPYNLAIWGFTICAAAAAGLTVLLLLWDAAQGVILNASAKDRTARMEEKARQQAVPHRPIPAPFAVYLVRAGFTPKTSTHLRRNYLAKIGVYGTHSPIPTTINGSTKL